LRRCDIDLLGTDDSRTENPDLDDEDPTMPQSLLQRLRLPLSRRNPTGILYFWGRRYVGSETIVQELILPIIDLGQAFRAAIIEVIRQARLSLSDGSWLNVSAVRNRIKNQFL
jgi:hypothetical protein